MTRARDVADTQDNLGGAVAPFVAGKNGVINGGFDIWQRGTSLPGGLFKNYTADRWVLFRNATTISRQSTSDTTNLPFIQYCARVQRDSGTSGTSGIEFQYSVATADAIPYAGKVVTLSFYARKGANFSTTSSVLQMALYSGTGTDQALIDGYTGSTVVASANPVLTTTWQRFSVTGTVATTATELAIAFNFTPTGTAGAADYFEVTGVQLEIGSVATPFARAGGSIGGELALCQRYYQQPTTGVYWNGQAISGVNFYVMVYFPVAMRAAPTVITTSIAAGNFPATASSPAFVGTTSFANTRIASGTGAGGFADTYTASAEL